MLQIVLAGQRYALNMIDVENMHNDKLIIIIINYGVDGIDDDDDDSETSVGGSDHSGSIYRSQSHVQSLCIIWKGATEAASAARLSQSGAQDEKSASLRSTITTF